LRRVEGQLYLLSWESWFLHINSSSLKHLSDTELISPRSADQSIDLARCLAFLSVCAASVAIWWKPCLTTMALALKNSEYSHVLIIIPITAALVFCRRRTLRRSIRFDPTVGTPLLLVSLAAGLWSSRASFTAPDLKLFVSMFALVTCWIGAIVMCFGRRVFRLVLFPILFLFWVVPWPEFFLSRVVIALQQASATLTYIMFEALRVPVRKNGVILSIPGLDIEVAKECSSIRSSLILVITSMLLAHLLLRSAWRRRLVILLTIPLSVAKNAVRIVTLSMLGTHVDASFLTGRLHHQGGVIFFSFSVICLWLLIQMLQERNAGHL
jgi:exosortase